MAQARRRRSAEAGSRLTMAGASSGMGLLLVGFFIGVISTTLYFGIRGEATGSDIGSGIRNLLQNSRATTAQEAPATPAAAPAKAATPKLDFYTVLPEIESVLPEATPAAKSPAKAQPAASASASVAPPSPTPAKAAHYMLQAASYQTPQDAERLKARLALTGVVAQIQKVTIDGRGTFYRVRLGPYSALGQLDAVDQKLAQQGIKAMRLKVSEGG